MEQTNFNELFDQWATSYDRTVYDQDGEYSEVFANYDLILKKVATSFKLPKGSKIGDIGVGSGNLTGRLIAEQYNVIGIEPSEEMRKLASRKLPEITIYNGSFLSLPEEVQHMDGFASSYALHHLTDKEKQVSLVDMAKRLKPGGKVVIADTAYRDLTAKKQIFEQVQHNNQVNLLKDLETEYYTLIEVMEQCFIRAGLTFRSEQLNTFVWLFEGEKK